MSKEELDPKGYYLILRLDDGESDKDRLKAARAGAKGYALTILCNLPKNHPLREQAEELRKQLQKFDKQS